MAVLLWQPHVVGCQHIAHDSENLFADQFVHDRLHASFSVNQHTRFQQKRQVSLLSRTWFAARRLRLLDRLFVGCRIQFLAQSCKSF
jgi:hypothetical protein